MNHVGASILRRGFGAYSSIAESRNHKGPLRNYVGNYVCLYIRSCMSELEVFTKLKQNQE